MDSLAAEGLLQLSNILLWDENEFTDGKHSAYNENDPNAMVFEDMVIGDKLYFSPHIKLPARYFLVRTAIQLPFHML